MLKRMKGTFICLQDIIMPLKSMSGLHGCSLQPSQRQESHGISRESSSRLGKIRSQEAECLECRLCSVMRFICTFEVPSLRNRSQQSSRPHGEWRKTPWPKMFFLVVHLWCLVDVMWLCLKVGIPGYHHLWDKL